MRAGPAGRQASFRPVLQAVLQAGTFRRLREVVDKVRPALVAVDCTSRLAVGPILSRDVPSVLSLPFLPSNVLTSHNPFAQVPDLETGVRLPDDGYAGHRGAGQVEILDGILAARRVIAKRYDGHLADVPA
ncbi:hypothetical protein LK08_11360 [Streptomyces sp. MUSC 125]|nr:hypothetical protein LK08_11360 [Streptomyces sp. MUSC 125]